MTIASTERPISERMAPRPWKVGTAGHSDTLYDADGAPVALIFDVANAQGDNASARAIQRAVAAYDDIVELLRAITTQAPLAVAFGGRLHLTSDLEQRALALLERYDEEA